MDFYKKVKDILFLDIETVSCSPSFEDLNERMKPLWKKKASFLKSMDSEEDAYFNKAGIFAEFGKIIVISIGFYFKNEGELGLRVKSFAGHDEKALLSEFNELIENKFNPKHLKFCAHNGKEFDFPYLCRRMLVNSIPLPESLDIGEKKPWEVKHLDTLEMWKFGDKKNFTSLELLAALFDIPTSKDGIDGSMVNNAYYLNDALDKIAEYCEKDVIVTAQLFLRFNNREIIQPQNIFII